MFVSTGNNFGAGPISFKDVQESEYVVLNAKISCVPTSAAYQAAEQLEIYVPALSIDRSAESFATAVYTDRVPHTGYTTVFDGGTFLKTWIKDRNRSFPPLTERLISRSTSRPCSRASTPGRIPSAARRRA